MKSPQLSVHSATNVPPLTDRCPALQKHKYTPLTKAGKLYCRHAVGDRRRQFPDCCPRIICKHFVNGKLVLLPEHMHPKL